MSTPACAGFEDGGDCQYGRNNQGKPNGQTNSCLHWLEDGNAIEDILDRCEDCVDLCITEPPTLSPTASSPPSPPPTSDPGPYSSGIEPGVLGVLCASALLVVNHIREKYDQDTTSVKSIVWDTKGGPSGGTIDTVLNTIENFSSIPYLKESSAPYGLNPPNTVPSPEVDTGDGDGIVKFDKNLNCWHFPFVMAGINSKVVRRSNGLANGKYGSSFSYAEVQRAGGLLQAIGNVFGLAAAVIFLIFPPTRWLLKRFALPKPGEGPDKETRETGFFTNKVIGFSAGSNPKKVLAEVRSVACGDPGYKCTAQMLVESAMCLVKGEIENPPRFGVVTPAYCMGKGLIKRLNDTGMKFEIIESAD